MANFDTLTESLESNDEDLLLIRDSLTNTAKKQKTSTLINNKVLKLTDLAFANISDLKLGVTNGGSSIDLTSVPDGTKVSWMGRYERSDGGSNWGRVRFGTHAEDGGSIFSIDANTYVEANLKGKRISVKKFGARGNSNGTTGNGQDDITHIQATLDYLEGNGGGIATLTKTDGQYRVTDTIRVGGYCTLEGINKSRYPFNNDVPDNSCLMADFSTFDKWVVDGKTTNGGQYYAYDETTLGSQPDGWTFNSSVKDLLITSVGVIPYGGVRFIGCPGSTADNVAVFNTSIGCLINYCFGGNYKIHTLTHYYGVICWDSVNANDIEAYCTKITSSSQVVPADYVPPFMSALNGSLVTAYKLQTESHYNRAFGLIVGSDSGTLSTGNVISYTGEKFSGGSFQLFSYGTNFTKYYVEGTATEMRYGLVSANSRFNTDNFHCFLSDPSNEFFDMGIGNIANYTMVGLRSGSYGNGPFADNSSNVTFHGVPPSVAGFPKQFNVFYTYGFESKTPTLLNSWVNAGGIKRNANYIFIPQLNRVKLRGAISGGSNANPAFQLDSGFRPPFAVDFTIRGGEARILADGNVIITSGTNVDLDAIEFEIF